MLFEENNQTNAANVSATDAEGLIGTAGATVFQQELNDAMASKVSPFSIKNGMLYVKYTKED